MPKVTPPQDHPTDSFDVAGQRVAKGETIEVDADTAASLAEQGWVFSSDDLPSKDELLAIAADRGVDVKPSWSRQKISDALAAAPLTPEAPEGADTQEKQP